MMKSNSKISKFKNNTLKKKTFNKNNIIDKIPSMNEYELGGLRVTFHGHDGSKRGMTCRKGFFNHLMNGKRLTSGEIVMKINTFKHDFGAKYFTIQ